VNCIFYLFLFFLVFGFVERLDVRPCRRALDLRVGFGGMDVHPLMAAFTYIEV
jgi:hypothetical protein